MKSIGLETNFNKIGICGRGDRKIIIDNINLQRLENNPVKICDKTIIRIITN